MIAPTEMVLKTLQELKEGFIQHDVLLVRLQNDIRTIQMQMAELTNHRDGKNTTRNRHRKQNDLLDDEKLFARLNKLIAGERLFMQPDVTLKEVARRLDVTQERLKQMFAAQERYPNLHKLLWHYRIEAACAIIEQHPHYSIKAISEECGFTSRMSFYRWFAYEKGCTPAEYLERCGKKQN